MRGQNQPLLPSEFCAPPLTDIITCPFYVVCPLFLLCLSAGGPNSIRSPCGVWIYSGGVALTERLDRPCPFCVCALRESLPRLAVPFASAHLSGLCASWWSGERVLMTLPISTTDSPHRLYSFFFFFAPEFEHVFKGARNHVRNVTHSLSNIVIVPAPLSRSCLSSCSFHIQYVFYLFLHWAAWSWQCEWVTRSSWSVA